MRCGDQALEILQSQVELRPGGETGVASVRCLSGADQVWPWLDSASGSWTAPLLEAAMRALESGGGVAEGTNGVIDRSAVDAVDKPLTKSEHVAVTASIAKPVTKPVCDSKCESQRVTVNEAKRESFQAQHRPELKPLAIAQRLAVTIAECKAQRESKQFTIVLAQRKPQHTPKSKPVRLANRDAIAIADDRATNKREPDVVAKRESIAVANRDAIAITDRATKREPDARTVIVAVAVANAHFVPGEPVVYRVFVHRHLFNDLVDGATGGVLGQHPRRGRWWIRPRKRRRRG